MKTRSQILHQLLNPGIVAIIRADSSEQLMHVAEALKNGGVTAMEVTMTTPHALDVIQKVTQRFKDEILMGVGTILDTETARSAILAGAEFVVSPVLNLDVIRLSRRYGKPCICGAYTPTEILSAWENGSDFVKIFPADNLGPSYIKAVKAPLPQVEVIPTGGVDLNTIGDFLKAGCAAVGVGSSLISKKIMQTQDWEALTDLAKKFVLAAQQARA